MRRGVPGDPDSEASAGTAPSTAASAAPCDQAARSEREGLRANLDKLTDLQRRVMELRYGLNDESPRTHAEIAQTFGLSLEKLQQIENQSLLALRGPPQP